MTGRPQVPYLGGRFFGGVDDVLCPALRSAVAGSRRGRAFRLRDDAVPGGGIGGRRRGGQGGQRWHAAASAAARSRRVLQPSLQRAGGGRSGSRLSLRGWPPDRKSTRLNSSH